MGARHCEEEMVQRPGAVSPVSPVSDPLVLTPEVAHRDVLISPIKPGDLHLPLRQEDMSRLFPTSYSAMVVAAFVVSSALFIAANATVAAEVFLATGGVVDTVQNESCRFNGTLLSLDLFNIVTFMWDAGLHGFVIWLLIWGVIWPYCKCMLQMAAWFRAMSRAARTRLLLVLEVLGHFSLTEMLLIAIIMGGLNIEVETDAADHPHLIAAFLGREAAATPPPPTDNTQHTPSPSSSIPIIQTCRDDPLGKLHVYGVSCALVGSFCDVDLSTLSEALPEGVYGWSLCPVTCTACATWMDEYRSGGFAFFGLPYTAEGNPTASPSNATPHPDTPQPSWSPPTDTPRGSKVPFYTSVELLPGPADYLFLAATLVAVLWGSAMTRLWATEVRGGTPAECTEQCAVKVGMVLVGCTALAMCVLGVVEKCLEWEIGGLLGMSMDDPVVTLSVVDLANALVTAKGGRTVVGLTVWIFVIVTSILLPILSTAAWLVPLSLKYRVSSWMRWLHPFAMADVVAWSLIVVDSAISGILEAGTDKAHAKGCFDGKKTKEPIFMLEASLRRGTWFLLAGTMISHAHTIATAMAFPECIPCIEPANISTPPQPEKYLCDTDEHPPENQQPARRVSLPLQDMQNTETHNRSETLASCDSHL